MHGYDSIRHEVFAFPALKKRPRFSLLGFDVEITFMA
jgi:hypothetical protein